MRRLALLGVLSALVLCSAADALAVAKKPSRLHRSGHVHATRTAVELASSLLVKAAALQSHAARPSGKAAPKALLSALELDIVARMNAQRGARGLRPLRVSRGLTAAAAYHSHEMGAF